MVERKSPDYECMVLEFKCQSCAEEVARKSAAVKIIQIFRPSPLCVSDLGSCVLKDHLGCVMSKTAIFPLYVVAFLRGT
jgi:hypothetical protein